MSFRGLFFVLLYILGMCWCYGVFERFRQDLKELLEVKGFLRKITIIFIWFLAGIIGFALVKFTFFMVREITGFVKLFT